MGIITSNFHRTYLIDLLIIQKFRNDTFTFFLKLVKKFSAAGKIGSPPPLTGLNRVEGWLVSSQDI